MTRSISMGLGLAGVLCLMACHLDSSYGKLPERPDLQVSGGSVTGNALGLRNDSGLVPALDMPSHALGLFLPPVANAHQSPLLPDTLSAPSPTSFLAPGLEGVRKDSSSALRDSSGFAIKCHQTECLANLLQSLGFSNGRILVVAPDGDDSKARPGLQGPYYLSLAFVPGGVQPGDAVLYKAGHYYSTSQLPPSGSSGTAAQPILYLAWPGEKVYLASALPTTLKSTNHIVFHGLLFTTLDRASYGLGLFRGNHISIQNCTFQENQEYGLRSEDVEGLVLRGNTFADNGRQSLLVLP